MSESEQAHLEAIRAAPDDDAPRLVYADWLLLRDDPRGELIQLQCRLESEQLTTAVRRKMRSAEKKLILEYEKTSAAAISTLLGYAPDARVVRTELRRGFVHKVKAPATILRRLDDVLAVAPLIEELEIFQVLPYTDEAPQLFAEDFAASGLARLRSLRVWLPFINVASLHALANAPTLANLSHLAIDGTRWHPRELREHHLFRVEGANALVGSPHLKLRSLSIEEGCFGNEGARVFVNGPWELSALNLANSGCDGGICEIIAEAPALASLERLTLRQTVNVLPHHAARLASAPTLKRLMALDLEKCDLHAQGIRAFLDGFALPAVEELIIASNTLADAGGLAVAESTKLNGLRVLDITKNRLGKTAITALASSEQFRNLRKILIHDRDTADARTALATSAVLANAQVYFRGHLVPKAV